MVVWRRSLCFVSQLLSTESSSLLPPAPQMYWEHPWLASRALVLGSGAREMGALSSGGHSPVGRRMAQLRTFSVLLHGRKGLWAT